MMQIVKSINGSEMCSITLGVFGVLIAGNACFNTKSNYNKPQTKPQGNPSNAVNRLFAIISRTPRCEASTIKINITTDVEITLIRGHKANDIPVY